MIGNVVGGVLLLVPLPPLLFHSCSLGYSSVDEVTPATVLPVAIADGQQHVFPEGDVCLIVAFAVVIVKFTICSMLHYPCHQNCTGGRWWCSIVQGVAASTVGSFEGRLGGGLFDS